VTAWQIVEKPFSDIEEFYAAHFQNLTIALFAYTGDFHVAQELVQEAFCRAIPRWEKLVQYEDPLGWVRKVAFNLAISRWRRARTALYFARRQREEHIAGPSPDRVAIVAALRNLAPKHRRVVVLHHLADMPISEIAEAEGVPEGTVRVWLHRGRAALGAQLKETAAAPVVREKEELRG
jgi:RNA polymerase sigma-70 factor (ECF subfamily)